MKIYYIYFEVADLSGAEGVDFLESDLDVKGSAADDLTVSECDDEWNINIVNADVEEDDISILYEDASGHGTSVVSVIAASGEKIKT